MSERIEVCPEGDLAPGDRRIVSIEGDRSVGVFNVEGEYYAMLNHCLHQGGPLCEGTIHPQVAADHGERGEPIREYHTDEYAIACPWHDWEYDVATGENIADPDVSVPVFDVAVEDGTLYLER